MATKPDLNTRPTSSEFDEFPGSLAERQARSYRPDPTVHRGTALAMVGPDGQPIARTTEEWLGVIAYELQALRAAMVLQGTAADLEDGVEAHI